MSDHGGGYDYQSPLPEAHASSRSAAKLLRPRRSYGWVIYILGSVALLAAIGLSRIVPDDQVSLHTQNKSEPPKRPDRFPEQPREPFVSFVLDAAQSYIIGMHAAGPLTKPNPSGEKN